MLTKDEVAQIKERAEYAYPGPWGLFGSVIYAPAPDLPEYADPNDVANCVVKSLQDERTTNQIISLGGPEHLAYEVITDLIVETLKLRRLKLHIPVSLIRLLSGQWRSCCFNLQ